mgnify:FL=1
MLNAEDTKERIRKLRLKVVSGPIDPVVEDNFKENILESTKITTGWNDTAGSENAGQNKIKKNNFIKENVEKALVSLSQKKSKKFQDQNDTKNLNSNMFSQSTIQNEIDNRITNNSKLIIELFNERIEDLKSKIVNTDNFDDFRNRIAEQLEVSITHITEKLNEKIIEIRKQTDQSDKELNNLINKKSLELLNTTKEKINLFSDRLNVYDNKFPETTKKLEEKIYSDINHLVDEFSSKIKVETDKVTLINEMFKNDFTKITENLEELDRKTDEKINTLSNDFETEKSESINQFSLVTGSHNSLKRDFDDFRDSAGLKSDALASEISFQIDDLNTEFNKKLNVFNQELESAIDTFNTDNKSIIGKFDVKFENLHETVSSIASQIHKDNQELKSDLDKRVNFLENNSIKQIDYLENELNKNLDTNEKAIDTIKSSLEKIIDENKKQSLDKIQLVDKNIAERLDVFNKELKTYSLSLYDELNEEINKSNIKSNDFLQNTNISISGLKKEIEDGKKILLTEVLRKNNDLKESFKKGLDETNKNLNNSFIEMKKAYDLKIKNYANIFDAKIMQNDESNKQNIDKLNQSLSEIKSKTESNFSELSIKLSNINDVIINYKKENTDNQKILETKFIEAQKNVLGLFKDKYKTLKSQIWGEFSIFRNANKKNLEKINQIEKMMVTLPTLNKNIQTQLKNENNKLKLKISNQIHEVNDLITGLENRILSEKELIEIFQNHSLNVNIAQNDKLLSKVKKQYENQKLNQPKKNKLSKMISVVILTFALISILKIFT